MRVKVLSQYKFICKNCKIKFEDRNYHKKRLFCSKRCFAIFYNIERSKWRKIWSKEILEKLYYKEKMSMSEIARKYNTNVSNIFQWFKRFDIKKRPFSELVRIGIKRNIKNRVSNKGSKNPMFGRISYPKSRFYPSLGHSIRSSWERQIAEVLKSNNISYKYEGIKFTVNNGNNTWTPDFIIGNILVEVKGMLSDDSKKKMIETKRLYPSFKLWIITSKNKRFTFDFADKVFFCFYRKRINKKNDYEMDKKEIMRFLDEIRKNLKNRKNK